MPTHQAATNFQACLWFVASVEKKQSAQGLGKHEMTNQDKASC